VLFGFLVSLLFLDKPNITMSSSSGEQHSNTDTIEERMASVTLDSHLYDPNHTIPQDNDVHDYQDDGDGDGDNDDDDDDDDDSKDKRTLKVRLMENGGGRGKDYSANV
jgi:hypothetical protein